MSDYYKCEHGGTLCGSCVRGLKVQYTALEKRAEALVGALSKIAENPERDHRGDICRSDCPEIAVKALKAYERE